MIMTASKRKNKEIGSNFFDVERSAQPNKLAGQDLIFYLSGRMALRQIIRDIKRDKTIKRASLPSYCCESMIEPFLKENIEVIFYDVFLKSGKIVCNGDGINNADMILTLNYFGIDTSCTRKFEQEIRAAHPDSVIIKDATHSLLSDDVYDDTYDYVFASIRKWSGLSGGVILKSSPDIEPLTRLNMDYEKTVHEAMSAKKEYIRDGKGSKERFLSLYNKAEEMLDSDPAGYGISKNAKEQFRYFDLDRVAGSRKSNCQILADNQDIWRMKGIEPVCADLSEGDIPLFFPVIFRSKEHRDKLRKYLIDNEVYCPVHWPVSPAHRLTGKTIEIYDRCLSVICDQRYSTADMLRIMGLIDSYKGEDI